jgi:diguanylate cyclase (GGDEF)-like protein
MKKLLLLLTVIALMFTSMAGHTRDYLFNNINMEDGLPSRYTTSIFQQSNGVLWFGTVEGVVQYDGNKYKTYNTNTDIAISNNVITTMYETSDQQLWVGTEQGINLFENGTFKQYQLSFKEEHPLLDRRVESMLMTSDGDFLIAVADNILRYNKILDTFEKIKTNLPKTIIRKILTVDNTLYLGTDDGLFTLDVTTMTVNKLLSNINISHALHINNIIWLATEENGVVLYDTLINQEKTRINAQTHGLIDNHIIALHHHKEQVFVAHFSTGISVLDVKGEVVSVQLVNNEENHYDITGYDLFDVFVDSSNVLWVATAHGLSRTSLLKQYRQFYFNADQYGKRMSTGSYNSLNINEDLYSASSDWLRKLNTQTNTLETVEGGLDTIAWHIAKDNKDNIWIAHDQGISIYRTKTKEYEHFFNTKNNPYGLPENEYYTVLPISTTRAWITGYKNVGLFLFDIKEKKIIKKYLTDSSIYGQSLTNQKIIDNNGNVWMATTNGVIKVNPTTNKVDYLLSGSNTRVSDITLDRDGIVWISTVDNHICRINPIDNTVFDVKLNTETFDGYRGIVVENSTLWISTQKDILAYDLYSTELKKYLNASPENSNLFQNNSLRLHNDALFVSSLKGVLKIFKNDLTINDNPTNLIFTDILSNRQFITHKDEPELSYENNNVSFEFSSADYTDPKTHTFSYKLAGYDTQWQTSNNSNTAYYTNLKPNQYNFIVKSIDANNYVSKINYPFTVNQAWWFYIIVMLVFSIIIILSYLFINRHRRITHLQQEVATDHLTSIANRTAFHHDLKKKIYNNQNCAIAFIDLDNFKAVNDTLGHSTGDQFLILFAKHLSEVLSKKEKCYRLNGDEFAIIFSRRNNNILKRTVDIHNALVKAFQINNNIVLSNNSVGVALFPEHGNNYDEILSNADVAMYDAKKRGKNNVSMYAVEMNEEYNKKLTIRNLLDSALKNKELYLNYQPQVAVDTGKVYAVEALARWQNNTLGFVPPSVFIPEAERSGKIVEIGQWVMEEACRTAKKWLNEGRNIQHISVNVSPIQIVHDNFYNMVVNVLKETGLPANRLELEVTEETFVDNLDQAHQKLADLQQLGVKIALDDFGVKYSSISYLKHLPLNTIKIDKSFVDDITHCHKNEMIYKNVLNLASDLNLDVITEGVEREDQLRVIKKYNCRIVQGYYYCAPMSEDELWHLRLLA